MVDLSSSFFENDYPKVSPNLTYPRPISWVLTGAQTLLGRCAWDSNVIFLFRSLYYTLMKHHGKHHHKHHGKHPLNIYICIYIYIRYT